MTRSLRNNGLTIVLLLLFAGALVGQAATGLVSENADRLEHGEDALGLFAYLGGGAFLSSLFENWESEFLQMSAYVVLTAYLMQRGSPESRDLDKDIPQDRDPALDAAREDAPWAVRAGGFARSLYAHSLGLALFALFLASFVLHFLNSARDAADQAAAHGQAAGGLLDHLGEAEFWFESFQNWQSEFLSTAVLIVLGVFLRQRGSPESKPVSAPHAQTGSD